MYSTQSLPDSNPLKSFRLKLRDYQADAVDQVIASLDSRSSPVVALPTGSGKSLIAAYLLRWAFENRLRAVCLSHLGEIIEQDYRAYCEAFGEAEAGIYCAGLGRKELGDPVLFASVQSLANAPPVNDIGLALIDEAHRIPFEETSQYRQLLDQWPEALRVGLSATPYRLDNGRLDEPGKKGEPALFDQAIKAVSVPELVDQGYLAPLSGVQSRGEIDTTGVHTRLGDYVVGELEQAAMQEGQSEEVAANIARHCEADGRRHVLVFGVSIAHCEELQAALSRYGTAGIVHGKMGANERRQTLDRFKGGHTRYLVNCEVLTTGFDFPAIDAIAVVRPTQSKALFVQAVGRGSRVAEGKDDCRILDFGSNLRRHTPLEELPSFDDEPEEDRKEKEKEKESGKQGKREHQFALDRQSAVKWQEQGHELIEANVQEMLFKVQYNRKDPSKRQVMVIYKTDHLGDIRIWLLPEHGHKARYHSNKWFARRGLDMPATADETAKVGRNLRPPQSIHVRCDENDFWRVEIEHWGENSLGIK